MVRLSDVRLLNVLPCSHLCIHKFYINVIWWFFHLQKLHILSILSNNEEKQWHNTRQYTIKFHMISKAFQIFWIQINITCDNTSSHDCTESWSTVLPWCALPHWLLGRFCLGHWRPEVSAVTKIESLCSRSSPVSYFCNSVVGLTKTLWCENLALQTQSQELGSIAYLFLVCPLVKI